MLQIKSNYRWHSLSSWHEIAPEIAEKEFEYIPEEERHTPRLMHYRGSWHDLEDMLKIGEELPLQFQGWDAYKPDTFFSGIVIRYNKEDYDYVQIGTYYS
jgi:hypothetical protein